MSKRPRIAIVTCARTDIPMTDNEPLRDALTDRGAAAELVIWDDPEADWTRYDAAIVRTTWDYFDKVEAFRRWLDEVAGSTRVFNDAAILRWNIDKHYLLHLEEAGAPIVPTRIANRSALPDVVASMQAEHGPTAVKPTIGGGAKGLRLLEPGERLRESDFLRVLGPGGAALVQPIVGSVRERGEVSLVWIGGRTRYAILKVPKAGDIRVQPEWGATYHAAEATAEQIEAAERSMAACERAVGRPLYARVDLVELADGSWALMELEVIEPEIMFAMAPQGAAAMAEALLAALPYDRA